MMEKMIIPNGFIIYLNKAESLIMQETICCRDDQRAS